MKPILRQIISIALGVGIALGVWRFGVWGAGLMASHGPTTTTTVPLDPSCTQVQPNIVICGISLDPPGTLH